MMYEEFVRDFAIRTKKNLEHIQKIKKEKSHDVEPDVFEVTQMVNSLLGLLVFPQQGYYNALSDKFPDLEIERILSKSKSTYRDELDQPKSFKKIIKHIRNAIAHERLNVYPHGPHEIKGIIFKDNRMGAETFELDIQIEDLDIFLSGMFDYIIDLNGGKYGCK